MVGATVMMETVEDTPVGIMEDGGREFTEPPVPEEKTQYTCSEIHIFKHLSWEILHKIDVGSQVRQYFLDDYSDCVRNVYTSKLRKFDIGSL